MDQEEQKSKQSMMERDEPRSKQSTKDDKIFTKEDEKLLRSLESYHGFLPREDLSALLKNDGDYLVRISEVDKDATTIRREIILSVYSGSEGMEPLSVEGDRAKHKLKLRNIIIKRSNSKYLVEPAKDFDTLKELLDFYKTNAGTVNNYKFQLTNPVPLRSWEFLHSDVHLGEILGEGAFGEVRAGTLRRKGKSMDVAIKLMKGSAMGNDLSKAKIKEMMKEARLMRNFKHRNVVRIYGIGVQEQPLYIILELVKGGALNSYLKTNAGHVRLKEKLDMCHQAALGVNFLHRHQCIHRDLAARNCLYSQDKVVKISDFGLSRLGTVYAIKTAIKLPIKWLAPETIQTLTFSLKTDVFSYGVMLYEIFADGGEPWDDFTNAEVKKAVVEGKTLSLSEEAPEKLRTFLRERVFCKDPNERATMTEVVAFFELNLDIHHSKSDDHNTNTVSTKRSSGSKSAMNSVMSSKMVTTSHMSEMRDATSAVVKDKSLKERSQKGSKLKKRKKGFHQKA